MGKPQRIQREMDAAVEVLKDILITQLGVAGVSQQSIRKIVGCNMNRVTDIVKHLKSPKRGETEAGR
jgi:hypothetical protein